jgi:hypothetical protein
VRPAEAINSYPKEHAPTKTSAIKRWIADISADILRWWDQKKLSDVTETACNDYVGWRTAQPLTTTSNRITSRGNCCTRAECFASRHQPLAQEVCADDGDAGRDIAEEA